MTLPTGLSEQAGQSVRDTLGAAVQTSAALPDELGAAVLGAARAAFLHGVHVTAGITAVAAVIISVIAVLRLRHIPAGVLNEED